VATPGRFGGRTGLLITDAESGVAEIIPLPEPTQHVDHGVSVEFTDRGSLLIGSSDGLLEWSPTTRTTRPVAQGLTDGRTDRDGRLAIARPRADGVSDFVSIVDLMRGTTTVLESHGPDVVEAALDPEGRFAITGDWDGRVRVGSVAGEAPHVFVMTWSRVSALTVSPDGRWIAAGHADGAIRLWPVPDLDATPILDLPRPEFLETLRRRTNLRAIPHPQKPPGWYLIKAVEPFQGWEGNRISESPNP
jgi:WD40 repeat protein